MKSEKVSRLVEYAFFFGLLALSGYMVWLIMSPFLSALALSAIIVTICSPLHERIKTKMPNQNKTLAALMTTLLVLIIIILPVILLSSLLVKEAVGLYSDISSGQDIAFTQLLGATEGKIQQFIPGYQINLTDQLSVAGQWLAAHFGAIFAGTISTIFTFILSILGSFYFFRDGKELMQVLIKASPLPDREDQVIFDRIAKAIRAVATGTLLLAIIQGTLVAIGFWMFGISRPILWGSLASLGALMPGVGTTIVTAPAIIYLFATGSTFMSGGLLLWSILIVGLVDNLVGPYLIGRGSNLHPFVVLISVLGGIALFGPLGFVVGPVISTLFFVLLEIYNQYIVKDRPVV
ncbi:MAG: AI-2E family transporter [Patescibacteria group bacterium]